MISAEMQLLQAGIVIASQAISLESLTRQTRANASCCHPLACRLVMTSRLEVAAVTARELAAMREQLAAAGAESERLLAQLNEVCAKPTNRSLSTVTRI